MNEEQFDKEFAKLYELKQEVFDLLDYYEHYKGFIQSPCLDYGVENCYEQTKEFLLNDEPEHYFDRKIPLTNLENLGDFVFETKYYIFLKQKIEQKINKLEEFFKNEYCLYLEKALAEAEKSVSECVKTKFHWDVEENSFLTEEEVDTILDECDSETEL